jgi:hypothetical protein
MIVKESKGLHCVDCDPVTMKVFINECDQTSVTQKWMVGYINETMMADYENSGVKLMS